MVLNIQIKRTWDLARDSDPHKLTGSHQNFCMLMKTDFLESVIMSMYFLIYLLSFRHSHVLFSYVI